MTRNTETPAKQRAGISVSTFDAPRAAGASSRAVSVAVFGVFA